ncbi:hypothetical protein SKAU_G00060690 [Synaphobranchus kaupii]|uniref:Uncharacterized protein n=1 Tax=Synaphobranchus kaupii TaxID=118154 RepID=A0A9Q1G5Z4_SYNKA|nr:hypothetical protein SKAU_G00060690 [Synaphobranchus kaupii]
MWRNWGDMPQANHCANCLSSTANKRCRICTVDKADLSNPQVASEAPRRTKANTNIIIAGMSEMGVVERKRQETETGTLFSQNNQLFSDDIVIEPHIQTRIDYFHLDALGTTLAQAASLTDDEARQLQVEICDHHKLFERIWKADVANRANIHYGYHTREQTDVLGHPMIGDCNRFERYHHRVKDMVIAHKNGVSMEKTMVKRIAVLDSLSTLSAPNHVADNTSVHGLPGYAPVYRASGSVALVSATELRQRRGLGLRQHGNEVLPELSKNMWQPDLMERMENRVLTQEQVFLGPKVCKKRESLSSTVLTTLLRGKQRRDSLNIRLQHCPLKHTNLI